MSHPLWTLYNSVTEQTLEGLDVSGSLAALSSYSTEELAIWFAWHEGMADWKPILELPEFASLNVPAPAKPALSIVSEAPVVAEAASAEVTTAFPEEVTKTMEMTVTNFEVTEVTEITQATTITPATLTAQAPAYEVPKAAWTAPVAPAPIATEPTSHFEEFEPTQSGYNPDATHAGFNPDATHAGYTPEPTPVEPAPATLPQPVVETVAAPVAQASTEEAPPAQDGDESTLFWMTEAPDGTLTPANLDEMTGSHVYAGPAPVTLSAESEHLAAQAETMPDHVVVTKVETPSRQASFPLASGSAPGGSADPSASARSGADRRKYPRFDIRYRVIVRNDNLTFRTFSKNISLGGVALEMPVPEALLGSECQIYVGNPRTGENIRFSGKLVSNRNDSQFFVFLKSSPDSLTKLQKWVEAAQSHAKRSA